jgi:site-specific DNA recombinase
LGDIDGTDYKTIKTEAEKKISLSEANLSELPSKTMSVTEVEAILDKAIFTLTKLDVICCKSDVKLRNRGNWFDVPRKIHI